MKLDIGCGKRKLGNINIDLDRKCKPNIIADAHHLPFKPNLFNKIYCFEVIEHLDSPIKMLKEACRVLKNEGKIIISTPNPYFWRRIIKSILKKEVVHEGHITLFSLNELRNLLQKTQFNIEYLDFQETKWTNEYFGTHKFRDYMIPIKALGMRQILVIAKKVN